MIVNINFAHVILQANCQLSAHIPGRLYSTTIELSWSTMPLIQLGTKVCLSKFSSFGFRSALVSWMSRFLSKWTICTRLDGVRSQLFVFPRSHTCPNSVSSLLVIFLHQLPTFFTVSLMMLLLRCSLSSSTATTNVDHDCAVLIASIASDLGRISA